MKHPFVFVSVAALTLCLTLPAVGQAKMTRSEAGSIRTERNMDRQTYRNQERHQDRQQMRNEIREQDSNQIREQVLEQKRDQVREPASEPIREQKRDVQTDSVDGSQDLLRDQQQDRQQLQTDKE